MARALQLLGAGVLLALAACSSQPAGPTPAEGETPRLYLRLGVYEDGVAFMEWNDGLYHMFQCLGSLGSPDGAGVTMELKEHEGGGLTKLTDILELKLNLKVTDDGAFIITGTYKSEEPFDLEILGSTENEEDHAVLSYDAGSGAVAYTGEPPYTYERPER